MRHVSSRRDSTRVASPRIKRASRFAGHLARDRERMDGARALARADLVPAGRAESLPVHPPQLYEAALGSPDARAHAAFRRFEMRGSRKGSPRGHQGSERCGWARNTCPVWIAHGRSSPVTPKITARPPITRHGAVTRSVQPRVAFLAARQTRLDMISRSRCTWSCSRPYRTPGCSRRAPRVPDGVRVFWEHP